MSMLVSKDLVLKRFGTPTDIIEGGEYDEYYYDFGVFEERVNYSDPKISTVSQQTDSVYSPANTEVAPRMRCERHVGNARSSECEVPVAPHKHFD